MNFSEYLTIAIVLFVVFCDKTAAKIFLSAAGVSFSALCLYFLFNSFCKLFINLGAACCHV